jgi:hypothetical protein
MGTGGVFVSGGSTAAAGQRIITDSARRRRAEGHA